MAFPWLETGEGPPNKGKRKPDAERKKLSEARKRLLATGWEPSKKGQKMHYSPEHLEKLKANLVKASDAKRKPFGHKVETRGYVLVKCPDHPSANNVGYVPEHRLVAEAAIGRRLKRREVVHHINGNRGDNRNSNLLICSNSYHHWLHGRMSQLYQQAMFGG